MQSWLEGRNRKENVHKQQGWRQAWEYCQAKPIQTLGRASQGVNWSWSQCIKSHHAQTSSGKELPSHFWTRNIIRSILPGLRRKSTGLLLSGLKSSFQMKVNVVFHLEIKVPESVGREERQNPCSWSPVWSFHSQWWFGLPCHLLVLVHCVFWSPQSTQTSSGHFRALHASFCWQALWRCWFHFPAGLGTCPHCQRYQKLVQWPCVTVFDWPANSPDLNLIENLDERHQTQQCRWPEAHRESRWETPDPTMQMTWTSENLDERHQTQQCRWPEGRYRSSLGFITPEQCHRLIDSMPRRIDAVIHAKGGPTKYWVHRNEHTFQKPGIYI